MEIDEIVTINGVQHRIQALTPFGMGQSIHVKIDGYSLGYINKMSTGWIPYLNTDLLTSDDIGAILDRVLGC